MAAPLVEWKEGRDWTAAAVGAVRIPPIPPVLWAVPGLLAAFTGWAVSEQSLPLVALGVLATLAALGGLSRLWWVRSKRQECVESAALAKRWAASVPMRQAWGKLAGAFDRLGWFDDVEEKLPPLPTGKTDADGRPVLESRTRTVRHYPQAYLTTQDPEEEVRVLVCTTSGLVTSSQAETRASDLADFLGLNGWAVEVRPAPQPGYIEIRLARSSGRDLYGR